MSVQLNHTIVHAHDREETAQFFSDVLGLPHAASYGPFRVVELENAVSLDVIVDPGDFATQHYAFLVSEPEFDEIFGRIKDRGLTYWADPHHHRPGETSTNDGGRGLYWDDPNGHNLEIITVPYGG